MELADIAPERNFKQKVTLGGIIFAVVLALVVTYIWCGIDPFKLYQKRLNAYEYIFGRHLSQNEKEQVMKQAERLPEIMAFEDSYQAIKKEYKAKGLTVDSITLQKEAREVADEKLAAMSDKERARIVHEEYERLLDSKKGGYFPPNTEWENLKDYFRALIETVAIAIWGTLLAFIVSIPISMFAAKNTLELMVSGDEWWSKLIRRLSQFAVRRLLDFCRGFNEFVMALIFVAVIGLGPYAGVLALAIHTFGILGKVFSEAIEAIEPGQVEAAMASGAGPAQTMAFSVLPQVMPLVVSYSLLRFESNVRSATILGFVGAGGIGFLMFDKINGYLYREVCTMMIIVILSVTVIDYICAMLRRRFV